MSKLKAYEAYICHNEFFQDELPKKKDAIVESTSHNEEDDWWDYAAKIECYMKEDADKVLAELEESHKTEVKELLCLIRDKENNFNRAFDSVEKELRHQKYKRCLAMAEYCKVCSTYYLNVSEIEKDEDMVAEYSNISDWYDKWKERWLELAEKFKEAK